MHRGGRGKTLVRNTFVDDEKHPDENEPNAQSNGAPAVVEGSGRSAAAVVLGLLLVLAARGRA
jgi:hypothetical protein